MVAVPATDGPVCIMCWCHTPLTIPHALGLPAPPSQRVQESSWSLLTLLRLLLRYWFSFWEFRPAPAAAFAKFQGEQ